MEWLPDPPWNKAAGSKTEWKSFDLKMKLGKGPPLRCNLIVFGPWKAIRAERGQGYMYTKFRIFIPRFACVFGEDLYCFLRKSYPLCADMEYNRVINGTKSTSDELH
ncbi:hypothetical protein E5288_WYG009311 [Bos mutus]|uniref:Uncharacterized protein n=1 Tax=Bos mutus TaxID=72004 RepID=A0A6B0S3U3_9CETA|nr:hypothetical protein [Bos mutus]